jgi:hypothetical protein
LKSQAIGGSRVGPWLAQTEAVLTRGSDRLGVGAGHLHLDLSASPHPVPTREARQAGERSKDFKTFSVR